MQAQAILESALYAEDLDAAEAFYTAVFALPLIRKQPGQFTFLRCGAGVLLLFNPKASITPDPANPIPRHGSIGPGHLCFAATTADIPLWHAHFRALNIPIEADHIWPTGARSLYVRDPAGNSIEVGEPRMWGLA